MICQIPWVLTLVQAMKTMIIWNYFNFFVRRIGINLCLVQCTLFYFVSIIFNYNIHK